MSSISKIDTLIFLLYALMYSSEETPLLLNQTGGNGGRTASTAAVRGIPSSCWWSSNCRWRRVSCVVAIATSAVSAAIVTMTCLSFSPIIFEGNKINRFGSLDYDVERLARSGDVNHHHQQQHNHDDTHQNRKQQIWQKAKSSHT